MSVTKRSLVFSAIPQEGESFIGYLIRLTDVNHYDTSSWILQLANLRERLHKVSLAFDDRLNLTPLAHLTGVEEAKLKNLQYRPSTTRRQKYGEYFVLAAPAPRIAIRAHRPKVCTKCLIQYGYIRKIWDLAPVTVCPLHQCLLIDECPNCARPLPFTRGKVSICRCEYDWRKAPVIKVNGPELEVTNRVHSLCDLPGQNAKAAFDFPDNPLNKLKLKDLFLALFFVASQYRLNTHLKSKRVLIVKFGGNLRNADIHSLLSRAALVFHNWPTNYFNFLEWRKQNLQSTKHAGGVRKDFGPFEHALYTQLTASAFDFLRHGFEEYITTTWDGGYVRRLRRLGVRKHPNKKFVSLDEAKDLLKIGSGKIHRLLRDGALTAVIRSHGRTKVVLIETRSIEKVKAARAELLDRKQAAKRLGINIIQTQALVEANLLTERGSFDCRSSAFYSIQEIDGLIARVAKFVRPERSAISAQTIDFARALYTLACHRDIGAPDFIRSILRRKIKPCGTSTRPGLRKLNFYRRDIIDYQNEVYRRRYPNALSTYEAAESLKTSPRVIRFLIKKKLLTSQRVRWHLTVPRRGLSDFSSKYVLATTLASEVGRATYYLNKILDVEGINPVSSSKSERPQNLVYLKKDIAKLDLSAVVFAGALRLGCLKTQLQRVGISDAARLLATTDQTIERLITDGVLLPCNSKRRPKRPYCFTGYYLRKFSDGRIKKYFALVSISVAARMLGRTESSFRDKYVSTGRLNVTRVPGDERPYLRRKDIEELRASEKSILTPAAVRTLLKISESQLLRLVKSEELKPVSGPDIDRSAVNVFLKSDVERLRKQRESFKRKRAREGGSARFGKPAGPKHGPVIEAIAARVNALMTGALAQGTRISGIAIHKKLLSEGYEVGINSVYVCLRNARSLGVGSPLTENG
jgi:AraC-like DNA-binding protein